ncbi:MAG: hypothetical protein ACOC46_03725, partial [Pirellulales bacterium]
ALSASADAQQPAPESAGDVHVVARATIDGREVVRRTSGSLGGQRLTVVPAADIDVWVEPTELAAQAGDEVTFTVHVERRHGFGQRVPVNVRALRHGTRVLNVGLNGVLVTEEQQQRQVTVKIEPWTEPGTVRFYAVGTVENAGRNEHASPPVVLHIEPPRASAQR